MRVRLAHATLSLSGLLHLDFERGVPMRVLSFVFAQHFPEAQCPPPKERLPTCQKCFEKLALPDTVSLEQISKNYPAMQIGLQNEMPSN